MMLPSTCTPISSMTFGSRLEPRWSWNRRSRIKSIWKSFDRMYLCHHHRQGHPQARTTYLTAYRLPSLAAPGMALARTATWHDGAAEDGPLFSQRRGASEWRQPADLPLHEAAWSRGRGTRSMGAAAVAGTCGRAQAPSARQPAGGRGRRHGQLRACASCVAASCGRVRRRRGQLQVGDDGEAGGGITRSRLNHSSGFLFCGVDSR